MQTVRRRLFQTAGKIARYGRQTFLKISAPMLAGRVHCYPRVMRACAKGASSPKPRLRGCRVFALSAPNDEPPMGEPRPRY